MKPSETLKNFISGVFKEKKALAIWFQPGDQKIKAISCKTQHVKTLDDLRQLEDLKGFVFAPFDVAGSLPILLLEAENFYEGFEELPNITSGSVEFSDFLFSHEKQVVINHENYINACNELIIQIKNGKAEKVVFTRIYDHALNPKINPAKLLLDLHTAYPNAFSYLFYTPQSGMWMGATPEIILQSEKDHYMTMALAGTRESSAGKDIDWPEKDKDEQTFVSDFIAEKLKTSGIENYAHQGPYTFEAGNIEHLRSDFFIRKTELEGKLGTIIKALHPTPAVCGQPATSAMQLIRDFEKHQREYYSGFLGPLNLNESVNLFVNLRCAKIVNDSFLLFVGGGITKDSNALAEWNETEMKAQTLLRVIRKNELR